MISSLGKRVLEDDAAILVDCLAFVIVISC